MSNESTTRCPFLDDPSEECHVADLTSGAVESAIFYCGGQYEKCEIYMRLAKTGREEKDIGKKNSSSEISNGRIDNTSGKLRDRAVSGIDPEEVDPVSATGCIRRNAKEELL